MFAPLLFVGNWNFWIEPQRAQRAQRKRGERRGDRIFRTGALVESVAKVSIFHCFFTSA